MSEKTYEITVLYRNATKADIGHLLSDPRTSVLHKGDALAECDRLREQNRELLEALETARDYVYSELETRKSALAGYPHKWAQEERDLAQVDAAIRKAAGEEA